MELIGSFEATGAGGSLELGISIICVFPDSCYFQDTKIHLPHLFPELQIVGVLR